MLYKGSMDAWRVVADDDEAKKARDMGYVELDVLMNLAEQESPSPRKKVSSSRAKSKGKT